MTNIRQIVMTMTGEIFQPVRVIYKMHDKKKVTEKFNSLTCMEFDSEGDRYAWVYSGEAKKLKFARPVPKGVRPIVIGSFFNIIEGEMYLDVGSIERAMKAIPFFDKIIPRSAAEVDRIGISYKLISDQSEHPGSCFESIFKNVKYVDPEEKIEKWKKEHGKNLILKLMEESQKFYDKKSPDSFVDAEIISANYYEDGIKNLETALKMRQIVAHERWQGNSNYTLADVLRNIPSS